MPFTFAHPAIVLPLKWTSKKYFSTTGLVIGSMAPDFEYFLRMKIQSQYAHTIIGIFWFDLPLSLILSFMFHNVVRNALIDNLPVFLKSKLEDLCKWDWNDYFRKQCIVVLISILIGTCSHIFWDSFTHKHGYFVDRITLLNTSIMLFETRVPVYKILQHLSTLLGAIIIFWAIYRLPIQKRAESGINPTYWLIVSTVCCVSLAVRIFIGMDYTVYGNVIVSFIACFLIALLITPILMTNMGNHSDKGSR